MIKMIAADMDGKSLDENGEFDRSRFIQLLDRLDKENIKFVVATGNDMERLGMMFGDLCQRLYFVAENGTHLLEGLQTQVHQMIDEQLVKDFLRYFQNQHAHYCISLSTEQSTYMLEGAQFPVSSLRAITPEQQEMFLGRVNRVKSFENFTEKITKISMLVEESDCKTIMTDFNLHFNGNLTAITSGFGSIDIIQTGYHKAWGLSYFMEKYHVLPEEVMTFGDVGNDIEMLKLAGFSFAMDNAPLEVKQSAKFIAPSHTDAGVFQVVESYLDSLKA
ncbi:cof-like hydrolase [Streptococcus urinalis FB127-CNA-2]|uniref:HAD hydrolase, family IIB n=1 Tax=Streptococcus urinalis 2285-97 TaxID=764291 RepID=G5KFQ7_9STRE|nr:Cof-type HAD-IIB family hydrolase [Streptococcus urinalis]EHJ55916.1 HAD hydrolase, family IIB [Streptococcus urinalis 2285-97]EKS22119.1 cof-like hydrolase [Streptococcus urinalis FB127-CNA-2]VEF31931.1 haloacid dehalogenase-like hydrolase [Streptococcus urinalis]